MFIRPMCSLSNETIMVFMVRMLIFYSLISRNRNDFKESLTNLMAICFTFYKLLLFTTVYVMTVKVTWNQTMLMNVIAIA